MDMSLLAYTALLKHLKLPVAEISSPNSAMEVLLDPSVLSKIGIDIETKSLVEGHDGDTSSNEVPDDISLEVRKRQDQVRLES